MPGKRYVRWKACGRKRRYTTEVGAAEAAAAYRDDFGDDDVHHYVCPYASAPPHWHIGHPPKRASDDVRRVEDPA